MQNVLRTIILIVPLMLIAGCFGLKTVSFPDGTKVALIEIKGMIVEPDDTISDIEKVRKDKSYKAAVVRVDSPGGSVAASQELFRAIKKLDTKKPVVISMGDIAASGGYYVALGGRKIFADEGTVTGSIGVRMELLNAGQLFKLMRLEPETLKSGEFKDIGSVYRALKPEEREFLEAFLRELHDQFKKDVADVRGLDAKFVGEIADGRIFTGVKAKELGLIDEIGGMLEAADNAVELAGLKGEPNLVKVKKKTPWWVSIFEEKVDALFGGTVAKIFAHRYFLYEWKPY